MSYAKDILDLKASLDAELDDIIKRDVGVLNIGLPNMRCAYMLPKTLPEFSRKYPNVRVNIFEGTSAMIDKRLLEGDIDLAFYSKPHENNPHLVYERLARELLLICTCRNHPVKKSSINGKLDLKALMNERLILLSTEQRTGQISRYYLNEAGISLENSITTNNMPAVISLTEQGYGISFIFESHLRYTQPLPEVDCYTFGEPEAASDFVASYRKTGYMPLYAREFIGIAQKLYTE